MKCDGWLIQQNVGVKCDGWLILVTDEAAAGGADGTTGHG